MGCDVGLQRHRTAAELSDEIGRHLRAIGIDVGDEDICPVACQPISQPTSQIAIA